MKKIVILIIIGLSIFSLVACQNDVEIERISRYFDLEHPQEIWDGQFSERYFSENIEWSIQPMLIVLFKPFRSDLESAPHIELEHLRVRYAQVIRWDRRNLDEMFKAWQENPDIIRLFAHIFFSVERVNWELDRQHINAEVFTAAIRRLEKLPFIESVTPSTRATLGDPGEII